MIQIQTLTFFPKFLQNHQIPSVSSIRSYPASRILGQIYYSSIRALPLTRLHEHSVNRSSMICVSGREYSLLIVYFCELRGFSRFFAGHRGFLRIQIFFFVFSQIVDLLIALTFTFNNEHIAHTKSLLKRNCIVDYILDSHLAILY